MRGYAAEIRNSKDRVVAEFVIPGADTRDKADAFVSSMSLMHHYKVVLREVS